MTESVADLLAQLSPRAVTTPTLSGSISVQAWVHEFNILPGRYEGVTASNVYRHYEDWCHDQGHKAWHYPRVLYALRKVYGFTKGRVRVNNKDDRIFLMEENTARFFKNWLVNNPLTPDRMIPSTTKTNVQKALEELGVTP